DVPSGNLVFLISRNHDARVFLNGVQAAPAADWGDTEVLVPCSEVGRAALVKGRNVMAVKCEDADGGAPIEVGIGLTREEGAGRAQLIKEFGALVEQEPQRAELYAGRAGAFARQGRWSQAIEDFAKANELKPAAAFYFQLAVLSLE